MTPSKGTKRDVSQGTPANSTAVFNPLNISGLNDISILNESMLGDISPSDIYAATGNTGRYCLPFMAETEDKEI